VTVLNERKHPAEAADRHRAPARPLQDVDLTGGKGVRLSMYLIALVNEDATRNRVITWAIIFAMALIFLLPALVNGFPFVFYDTGTYLPSGGLRHPPPDRPIYYGIFNRLTDLKLSPWPTVVVQSLLTAWVIRCFTSAFFGLSEVSQLLSLAFFLTVGTSLPWFVGQLMPDIFTPLMILALSLVLLVPDILSRSSQLILAALISISAAFHQANFLVALWAVPAIVVCALLGWRPSKLFVNGLLASTIALAVGMAALFTVNVFGGRWALSSGGSVIFMARLLEDGPAIKYLDQACPQRHFALCAYLDEIKSYHPSTLTFPDGRFIEIPLSTWFLWGGPLEQLGNYRAEEAEASTIVANTLLSYPLSALRAAIGNAFRQLVSFRTILDPYPESVGISTAIQSVFGPVVYEHYRDSRQMRGDFGFSWFEGLNYFHCVILGGSVMVLIAYLGRRFKSRAFYGTVLVTILIIGNAFTMSILSSPAHRYQGRVMWLVPLFAGCFASAQIAGSLKQNDRRGVPYDGPGGPRTREPGSNS